MTVHIFEDKLTQGRKAESWLDRHFGQHWRIAPATRTDERRGIDRWFSDDVTSWSIQYKADEVAGQTGNAYIEVGSCGPLFHQNGWVFTTEANVIVYLIPGPRFWLLDPLKLRIEALGWMQQHRIRAAMNEGYATLGVCVPLSELDGCVSEVVL
jgi:hypothetical protein